MVDGIDLKIGSWVVTTEGFVGRVKSVEGDHVTVLVGTSEGAKLKRVTAASLSKVGR